MLGLSPVELSEEGTGEDREAEATSSVLSTGGMSVRDTRTLLHSLQRTEQKLPAHGGLCDLAQHPHSRPRPGPPAAPAAPLCKPELVSLPLS